ncbi:MAG: hypothetical protein Q3993_02740 [Filifactor alocis]|nr:hypothetical protein [Filifactor alocis]
MGDLTYHIFMISLVIFVILTIGSANFKKPLKFWGILLFVEGAGLFFYFPTLKPWASILLATGLAYLFRGSRIIGYRRPRIENDGWKRKKLLSWIREGIAEMNLRQKIGRGICLTLSCAMSFYFLFQALTSKEEAIGGAIVLSLLILYYGYQLLCIVLLHILGPLFIVNEETRRARLGGVVMVKWNMGKGIYINNPHFIFETGEIFVTYRMYLRRLREKTGLLCEYVVYTDIFGMEFMKEEPEIISYEKKKADPPKNPNYKEELAYYDGIIDEMEEEMEERRKRRWTNIVLLILILAASLVIPLMFFRYFMSLR